MILTQHIRDVLPLLILHDSDICRLRIRAAAINRSHRRGIGTGQRCDACLLIIVGDGYLHRGGKVVLQQAIEGCLLRATQRCVLHGTQVLLSIGEFFQRQTRIACNLCLGLLDQETSLFQRAIYID
jgi:hypothetical protein